MARKPIVTRANVEARYPTAPADFIPTHKVAVLHPYTEAVLRADYVALEPGNDVSFAYVPGEEEPVYGVLSTGLWQCLVVHGRIDVAPLRYKATYVPLKERDGLVYFVEAGRGGSIKIGWTQDLDRRIAELQTANAKKLYVLGSVAGTLDDESAFHARFAHLRLEAEWFENSSEIRDFLQSRR